MDLTNATMLAAVVFVAIDWVKQMIPTKLPPQLVQLASLVVGIGITFLMAGSVWAQQQVVSGHALSSLNTGSKIITGIVVGVGASVLDKIRGTVMNIGQNQPTVDIGPAPAPALDQAA